MISFKIEDKKFNFRVGAIIISNDKKRVLLHTIKGYDFYLLPGGRVDLMENSITSIKRELEEEIGLKEIDVKLRANFENFFEFSGMKFHEVANNFVVYLDEKHSKLEENEEFHGVEGEKYIFRWVNIDQIDNINLKPEVLTDYIKNHDKDFEYNVLKDNKRV